jgi:hypothetical protein
MPRRNQTGIKSDAQRSAQSPFSLVVGSWLRRLFDMQTDPQQHQGPQRDSERSGRDGLKTGQVLEVIVGASHDSADDEVDDEDQRADHFLAH